MRRPLRAVKLLLQAAIVFAALTIAAIFLLPTVSGWEVATVITGSMAPTYPAASVVVVAPVDANDVRPGNVIAFRIDAGRPMVVHRVVSVTDSVSGPLLRTKGDANEDADSQPVAPGNLRGRVVFGVPMLGYLVRAVHNPIGFAGLIAVPAVALILSESLSIRRAVCGRDQGVGDEGPVERAGCAGEPAEPVREPVRALGEGPVR